LCVRADEMLPDGSFYTQGGIAENICVQGKSEGIPTLQRLGFRPVLARDLTDAQSHYDPDTYRPDGGPWIHPCDLSLEPRLPSLRLLSSDESVWSRDYGTANVTRWIENGSPWTAPLGTTIEAAEIAKAFGTWEQPLEPILHAPWGTQLRPCAPSRPAGPTILPG